MLVFVPQEWMSDFMLTRATIIRPTEANAVETLNPAQISTRRGTIVRRAMVEASLKAQAVIEEANAQASEVLSNAQREASVLKQAAQEVGRAEGFAESVSRAATLGRMEATAEDRALGRTISLARLLAERLLGASLRLDEGTVAALAQQALNEVKGVRQVRLLVHPDDLAILQTNNVVSQPGFSLAPDANLARGDFRIVTDVGTIDATLGARLDLLAVKLADTLKKGN
jgi:flagellar biosynthesis/type III secretory pathway protein FliH